MKRSRTDARGCRCSLEGGCNAIESSLDPPFLQAVILCRDEHISVWLTRRRSTSEGLWQTGGRCCGSLIDTRETTDIPDLTAHYP